MTPLENIRKCFYEKQYVLECYEDMDCAEGDVCSEDGVCGRIFLIL